MPLCGEKLVVRPECIFRGRQPGEQQRKLATLADTARVAQATRTAPSAAPVK